MSQQAKVEHALRRRRGLIPIKAEALAKEFETAENLHWTCPKCKIMRTGTKKKLMEGCDCG